MTMVNIIAQNVNKLKGGTMRIITHFFNCSNKSKKSCIEGINSKYIPPPPPSPPPPPPPTTDDYQYNTGFHGMRLRGGRRKNKTRNKKRTKRRASRKN